MTNKGSGIKRSLKNFKKNIQALKQSNITLAQLPYIVKEFRLWWQITRNIKDLQGSWAGVLKVYFRIFKGST